MFKKQVTIPFIVFLCWYQLSLAMDQRPQEKGNGDEKSKNQVTAETSAKALALLKIRASLTDQIPQSKAQGGDKEKNQIVNPTAPTEAPAAEESDIEDDLSDDDSLAERMKARAVVHLYLNTTPQDKPQPRSQSVQFARRRG